MAKFGHLLDNFHIHGQATTEAAADQHWVESDIIGLSSSDTSTANIFVASGSCIPPQISSLPSLYAR